jgi:rod shape-determining protein MreC
MSRRPHALALLAVSAFVLVLLNLPEAIARKAKLTTSSLFLPLFGFANLTRDLGHQAGKRLLSPGVVPTDLEAVRRENQELRLLAAQGAEALRENERLRQLLGWQTQSPWKAKPARIIARDTANWWRTARIDRGTRDGVKPDLPVVSGEGLVGKTADVGLTTAEIIFVGDPKCRVAVVVRETAEHGVLSASSVGVLDHRLVDLTHLPRHTALRPGQTVLTSGLGGVFPAGLPVGTVVDHRSVGYGLYTEARVKLLADNCRLSEVMVLFP